MELAAQFLECRRVGDPILAVETTDYRETFATLSSLQTRGERDELDEQPWIFWDRLRGMQTNFESGVGSNGDYAQSPAEFLSVLHNAEVPPRFTCVYFVLPHNPWEAYDAPDLIQGIANLRDVFKANRRTLVLLAPTLQLPPLLSDTTQLSDPLPTQDQRTRQLKSVFPSLTPAAIKTAAQAARGMTSFAMENAVARNITDKGKKVNSMGVTTLKKVAVESQTNRALRFLEPDGSDVGGLQAIRDFHTRLNLGEHAPQLYVWIDEIDKVISASATGSVADNTGVSQDQLRTLLVSMEDNRWSGQLLVGAPGTGKSLIAKTLGQSHDTSTVAFDLGATKGSLVGQSEQAMRSAIQTLHDVGNSGVFFLATANRLDTLPPELLRRFNMGIWFFDVPDKPAREQIWAICKEQYGISSKAKLPVHDGWVGSDIRNCCNVAQKLSCTLIQAAKYITLSGRASLAEIDALRKLAAARGYLDCDSGGPYQPPKTDSLTKFRRAVELN